MTIEQIEDRDYLNRLFQHMPSTFLAILRAKYVLGYTAKEIGDNYKALGLPDYCLTPSYVYSLHNRAIGRLKRFNEWYELNEDSRDE